MLKIAVTGIILILTLSFSISIKAQPQPGNIFKNYTWTTPEDSYNFLRVIGDGDYREPVNFKEVYPKECFEDGWLKFSHEIDLEHAVKAEIQVEKLLSHDGTRGLSVKVNESNWLLFPEPKDLPKPQYNYLYHNYPVVSIPLEFLKAEKNLLRFKVDSIQRFNMPQNILYGIHLRVYYSEKKKHATAEISGISNHDKIGEKVGLQLKNTIGDIKKVDYIGFYEDINYQTDGIYLQWHYTYFRGKMFHQIGYSESSPFKIAWNTGWIPDQKKPFKIGAIVEDINGLCYFIEPIKGLLFERDFSIELCKPFNQPTKWATREKVFEEHFYYTGDPKQVVEFQLAWSTWSPGYMNGIYLNDWLVFIKEGGNYQPGFHRITIDKPHMLKQGLNSIKTGKTPKVFGKMVHGAEILYPGIMILARTQKPAIRISEMNWKNTPHFKVQNSNSTWYIEKQSGGCSSIIDSKGHDWIDFKKTGDNPPLMSSDSDFRGIPNLVFKEPGNGIGHPGFDQCTTKQISKNELLVKSKDGKWQFRWIFMANHAELVVEKTDDSRKYWFLYEGPSAGVFSPGNQYWGNSTDGIRTDCPSIYKDPQGGNWQWAFFGMRNVNTSLFVAQKEKDNAPDYFSYMGNDPKKQNLSVDGMNVFGFGRGLKTNPELSGENHFFIGLFPFALNKSENSKIFKTYISELIK